MVAMHVKDIMQIEIRQGVFCKEYWTFFKKPVMIFTGDSL